MKKVRVLVVTSNKDRHRYLCHILKKQHDLVGIVSEKKGDYYLEHQQKSDLVMSHFKTLSLKEKQIFGSLEFPSTPIYRLRKSEINLPDVIEWAKKKKPEVIVLFGTGLLDSNWLETFSGKIINIHLGYSPNYRGSATLFWPFFFNDLKHLGVTLHVAVENVDAGQILTIVKPDNLDGDYYSITTNLIKKALDNIGNIVYRYIDKSIQLKTQNTSLGKVYKKADFSEKSLKKVLLMFGER
ncbi:formyltransferase family protein [Amylibacter sp.]|jgi:methionyl-tRNA formyltransferase|nr:formyltransferase family protein [Amylibacter sp.]